LFVDGVNTVAILKTNATEHQLSCLLIVAQIMIYDEIVE